MNNIFLPSDPLLNAGYSLQLYDQILMRDREQIDKLYREYLNLMAKAKNEDKMGLLNELLHNLSPENKEILLENKEFILLNRELLDYVLYKVIEMLKEHINNNADMITNINKQLKIIADIELKAKEQERKNISDLNDYLTNYSNMSFDEYKKLKKDEQ